MRFRTVTSPHATTGNNVSKVMLSVIVALIPGTAAMGWFFGWGVLSNITVAVVTAWLAEAAVLRARRKPLLPTLKDHSALVTAWLLALALPPLAPWWLTAVGTAFAIVFAKQLYGGLGYNPFNPAMAGYVVLMISFPLEMSQWLPVRGSDGAALPTLNETLNAVFFGQLPAGGWDAISGATPLDHSKTQLTLAKTLDEIRQNPIYGEFAGRGWLWINLYFLLGGLYLIYRRIITWHTPLSLLAGLALTAGLFYLFDPAQHLSPLFHLFAGGIMLGAFFIATDPVSSCTSNRGKLVYGVCIGILIYVIRGWGGYPDGIAFSVLLLNMAAPFIDYYTKPRVFGHSRP